MMIYGPGSFPLELTLKVRPANRPDLQREVAQQVADFCWSNGITEAMIQDIRMAAPTYGIDDDGSYSQVVVRFVYR